jgi:hypothetical protein
VWDSPLLASQGAGITPYGSAGFEALASADAVAGADAAGVNIPQDTWLNLPVTRSLRAIDAGAADAGWLLQAFPNVTDAVRVESSESELAGGNYPELIVTRTADFAFTKSFTAGVDTTINQSSPSATAADTATLVMDSATDNANPGSPDTQALLKFTNLFGDAPAQIPVGARVASAVLIVNVNAAVSASDGGGFSVHRMLRDWTASDTWNSLLGGVSADNIEAALTPDDVAGRQNNAAPWDTVYIRAGQYHLDVTDSLRRWATPLSPPSAGGAPNHGWALLALPRATNAVIVDSLDSVTGIRPRLVVRYTMPPPPACAPDFNADGEVTVQDIFDFLAAWSENNPAADVNGGGITVQDIFDFLAAWTAGC